MRDEEVKNIFGYIGYQPLEHKDAPEKMADTLEFWEIVKGREDVEIVVSDLVLREIRKCSQPKLDFLLQKMLEVKYTFVEITEADKKLADVYLENGVLREKSLDDLTHIATASNNECRYIISWNFKHFVNPKTIRAVNFINNNSNLNTVDILPPSMMLGGF